MEITLKFDETELENVQAILDLMGGETKSTNEKIDKKIAEQKTKKRKGKKSKSKEEELEEEETGNTIDDVREALKNHAEECGKRNTSKILKKFAPHIDNLKKKQYAELIAALVEDMDEE